MLKKKGGAGFKPKAPVRRNAPVPSSQGAEERSSKTPAPSQPSTSRQPTPASTLSQTPAPETAASLPPSSIQPKATHSTADRAPESSSTDRQAPEAASEIATARIAGEAISRAGDNNDAASATTNVTGHETAQDNVKELSTRAQAAISPNSPAPEKNADSAPPQLSQTVATAAGITETGATESPVQAARVPGHRRTQLPTAAPSPSIHSPKSAISSVAGASAIPNVAASQPAEPIPQPLRLIPTNQQAIQVATPPTDSPVDVPQPSIEAAGDGENSQPPVAPAKSTRAPRKRKSAAKTAEADGDVAPAAKKPRRKRAAAPIEGGEIAQEGESSQPPAPKKRTRKPKAQSEVRSGGEEGVDTTTATRKGRFRPRSPTPEDAEEKQVDRQNVKMGDLIKDLRIGKKFSRHEELLERERMKKLKAKLGITAADNNEDGAATAASKPGTPAAGPQPNGESSSSSSAPKPAGEPVGAPQFQIIDGQIVVNQSTLQFDRHAAAAREAGDLEEEIEDDFTHHTTSNSYRKKVQKPNHWTEVETETFYRGLRMFGTDFGLLARMFPGKNRRHVKLKFNREERACPARVNDALVGEKKVAIDLEEYKSHTGLEYKSVEDIEAEQARIEEEFEAEQRRVEEEAAEEARKKKEELFGKGKGKEGKEGEEEQTKGKGTGRRKKKDAGGFGLGG